MNRIIQLLLVAGLVTGITRAADDPFVGQWKLDPSRSKLTDEMRVTQVNQDKYTFDLGNGPETIVVDGTDQPGKDGSTLSVTAVSPDAWKVVRKDGGTLITGNWKLSTDGKTLTDHFTQRSPNGATSTLDYVYQRQGGGSGFAGTWLSTSETVQFVYVLQIRPYAGSGLSIASPGSTRNLALDGKDSRRLDDHTLELTDKSSDGTIRDTKQIQISSDRKTLTMTTRVPGRSYPQILVFGRQ